MMPSDNCSSQEGQWHPAECAAQPAGIPVQYVPMQHMAWWHWRDLSGMEGHVWGHSITQHVAGVKISKFVLPTCRSVTECHAEYVQQVNKKLTDKGLDPQVSIDEEPSHSNMFTGSWQHLAAQQHCHYFVAAPGSTAMV